MPYEPWIGNLLVRGRPGNYGTVKLLVDEAGAASSASLPVQVEIAAQGHPGDAFEVEIFTNLDRRDFAKTFEPLSDSSNPASSYWLRHPMRYDRTSHGNLVYEATLQVTRCGAYRLTARYRLAGAQAWWWHNDFSPSPGAPRQRDCAIVVSPGKATMLRLYEANALTIEAVQGGSYENRSTLDDFLPSHDFDGFNPFQLDHVAHTLGFNTLWLMPVFPNTRWRWDIPSWRWTGNDDPGSPYGSRDYWSINPWLADNEHKDRAMELFQELVRRAAELQLDVFMDVAFNHAGRDVVYGQGAVDLALCSAAQRDEWIREVRPAWCTRGNEFVDGGVIAHYRERAASGFECAVWAPADRLNEHVWDDANVDWYFGDYASLGPKPGAARDPQGRGALFEDPRGGAEDERDLFYTDLASEDAADTERLWQYFAYIVPYWLARTDGRLAGIRADFAQGLPNQLWEYIVNKARQARWDFVFLAEVLDPDCVQYRLNKVFDVLTTKDHHLYRASDLTMGHLYGSLEAEARIFGSDAIVMHNGTSHDEQGNTDMWAMTARYAIAAALYGAPMVFMGQPLGLADKQSFRHHWADMYREWLQEDERRAPVAQMYHRINAARATERALSSPFRYFLQRKGGGFDEGIFSVARWAAPGDGASVVLVFVNLSTTQARGALFDIPLDVRLEGRYQARNLVADEPQATLWPAARSAADIHELGVAVLFSFPNEVQYLELVPV